MEKTYESRRLALKALVEKNGRGAIASISKTIEVDASYLSRCLYPPGKAGRKNIGDEIATKLDEKFPRWRSGEPTTSPSKPHSASVDDKRQDLTDAAVYFGHVFDQLNQVDKFDLWVDLKKRVMNYPKIQQECMPEIVKYLTMV